MSNWWLNALAVGCGGSVGALLRWAITLLMTDSPLASLTHNAARLIGGGASLGTTLANLLGCFLLGWVYQWTELLAVAGETPLSHRGLLFLRVGILGSLTTFSTLMGDVTVLGNSGRSLTGLSMLSVNVLGGWIAFLAAAFLTRAITS